MTPLAAMGIAVVLIYALLEALKKVFSSLASKFIPIIALILGIGAAVIIFYTVPDADLWVLLGGVVTALGSSGLYSYVQTTQTAIAEVKASKATTNSDVIVSPNDDYPAS